MTFQKLTAKEAPVVYNMVVARVDWMNEQGLRSWNTTNYLQRYPLSYYEKKAEEGLLYGLVNEDGAVLSAGVLLLRDERWPDQAEAIYLHNFISSMEAPGAGSAFLREMEQFAAAQGITLLRLDVIEGNTAMNQYYENRGYLVHGTCTDGPYHGILREKKL